MSADNPEEDKGYVFGDITRGLIGKLKGRKPSSSQEPPPSTTLTRYCFSPVNLDQIASDLEGGEHAPAGILLRFSEISRVLILHQDTLIGGSLLISSASDDLSIVAGSIRFFGEEFTSLTLSSWALLSDSVSTRHHRTKFVFLERTQHLIEAPITIASGTTSTFHWQPFDLLDPDFELAVEDRLPPSFEASRSSVRYGISATVRYATLSRPDHVFTARQLMLFHAPKLLPQHLASH